MTVPSARAASDGLSVTNPPSPCGAFDFVMVNAVPPTLRTVNVCVAVTPCGTWPYCNDDCEICICGAVPPVPSSEIEVLPPSVATVSSFVYSPTVAGVKVTVAVTLAPLAIVDPATGMPDTAYGGVGRFTPLTVSVDAPSLVSVTVLDTALPTATPPKLTQHGYTARCGPAVSPCPLRAILAVAPTVVAATSDPPAKPAVPGVKVTGTLRMSPGLSVAGSAGVDVPAVNRPPRAASDATVSAVLAVNVAVAVEVDPTTVVGKVTAGPASAALSGVPKIRT